MPDKPLEMAERVRAIAEHLKIASAEIEKALGLCILEPQLSSLSRMIGITVGNLNITREAIRRGQQ